MAAMGGVVARFAAPMIGAAVAVAVVLFLYRGLDLKKFVAAVAIADFRWVVILGGAILLEQLIQGWQWRQLLYDLKPISSWRLTGAIIAGHGANILVPLGISPLVRSWLIARLDGLRMTTVLITSLIGRFIDGIVFAIFAGIVALAGQIPNIEGSLRIGLAAAGMLNLVLFSIILWLIFKARSLLAHDHVWISRLIDWLASKTRGRLADLRAAIAAGIVWPRQPARRVGIIAASFVMKSISATHFLWSGLAVGITLGLFDYLFLMVIAGFALVLARFIRAPGGFVIGAGLALKVLGVPDEQALVMILFNYTVTVGLVLAIGLVVIGRSGVSLRKAPRAGGELGESR